MRYIAAVVLVGMGMAGLHFGIEYSGWVLLVALLMAL
jgi:hypothetical protein